MFLPHRSMTKVSMSLVVVVTAVALVCSPYYSVSASQQQQHEGPQRESSSSALLQAQRLKAPGAKLSYGGEAEHTDWWDDHEDLLQRARLEWGRKHPELYELDDNFVQSFLNPDLVRSLQSRDKRLFASLFRETAVPDVYIFQLFTPSFTHLLRDELEHHEASGIPLRRPNGMNRFGAILSDVGFAEMMNHLVRDYLVFAARHLFPDHVGPSDITHSYPFTVHYQPGQDIKLSEHTDASTITVNVCLQPSKNDTKVLYFKEQRTLQSDVAPLPATYIDLAEPGEAVIHLGQHVHGVADVDSLRHNLVVWLFAEYGYVRVAKYEPQEVKVHVREYDAFWDANSSTALPGSDSEL